MFNIVCITENYAQHAAVMFESLDATKCEGEYFRIFCITTFLKANIKDVDEVRSNPFIVHFCEPIKPWFKECRYPYRYLYKKYLKATPYKSYKFISCDSHFGKPSWRYIVKHWLNVLGLRNDGWSMVYLKH